MVEGDVLLAELCRHDKLAPGAVLDLEEGVFLQLDLHDGAARIRPNHPHGAASDQPELPLASRLVCEARAADHAVIG